MTDLPFTISGSIARGKQLGSRLGFPTANIAYDQSHAGWPREGVYVGVARVENHAGAHLAILNQGKHPTAPEGMPSVEAHLLFFPKEALYGYRMTLTYRAYLRAERAFPSLKALEEQLSRDREAAVEWARKNEPELIARALLACPAAAKGVEKL